MPKWAGGLGIPNLASLNIDRERPWREFNIAVPKESMALFRAATRAKAGDGSLIIFWEDRWLNGMLVEEIAPLIYASIPQRAKEARMLNDALSTGSWANDVRPSLNFESLQQYLNLWQRVNDFQLQDGTPDMLSWSWEGDESSQSDRRTPPSLLGEKWYQPRSSRGNREPHYGVGSSYGLP